MKILLISLGSRGDCEPFIAIGEKLRARGEDVVCAFPEQYRALAEERDLAFLSLGSEFLALIDTPEGRSAMGGEEKGLKKLQALMKIAKRSLPIQKQLLDREAEIFDEVKPDLVIFHPKIMYALPFGILYNKQVISVCTVPFIYHKLKFQDAKGYGKAFNPLVCTLSNFSIIKTLQSVCKAKFNHKLSYSRLKKELLNHKVIYTCSEALFKKPTYWGSQTFMAGFLEVDRKAQYTPPKELVEFLNTYNKIVFVTFGSMTNINPRGKTEALLKIVQKHHIPVIINISGGGFEELKDSRLSGVLFVKSIPYDFIMEKVYASVHHGGAGTLHASLKAGCSTMAVYHTADQPMWNHLIAKNEVGPEGLSIAAFEGPDLEAKLLDLYHNPLYKENALKISAQMKQEEVTESLCNFITQ